MINKVELNKVYESIQDYWSPVILHELNNQYVMAAKVKGEFVWHQHEHEDEYFQVVKGTLKIAFRDQLVELNEGESLVVPMGVEHQPIAEEECWILLFEPKQTAHTGGVDTDLKKDTHPKYQP